MFSRSYQFVVCIVKNKNSNNIIWNVVTKFKNDLPQSRRILHNIDMSMYNWIFLSIHVVCSYVKY